MVPICLSGTCPDHLQITRGYSVVRRDARVRVEIRSHAPAYLDEHFPIEIEVTNEDDVELDADLVVFLQPGVDGARQWTLPTLFPSLKS